MTSHLAPRDIAREDKAPPTTPSGDCPSDNLGDTTRHPLLPTLSPAYFEAILTIAADAVISIDESQRIVLFNRGAETMFGYTAADVLNGPLDILLPEGVHDTHAEEVRTFAASGSTARLMNDRRPLQGRRKNGKLFSAEASISRVEVDGRSFFSAVVHDVTDRLELEAASQALLKRERDARVDAERASLRATLLARASATLDASLDYERTLNALLHICVPQLASHCIIDVVSDDGTIRRLDLGDDAARDEVARELTNSQRDPSRSFLTRPAMVEGRGVLERHVTDADLFLFARDDLDLGRWRRLAPFSYICAPIGVAGHILGAITVIAEDGRRPYDGADLALVDEIASRAGLAIDNARLYGKARRATALRDDVLAAVSHDLRNPLSTISMALARLEEGPEPSVQARAQLLRIARESIDWMERMIRDLLDIASIDAGQLSIEREPADLVIVLVRAHALFEQLFAEHKIQFTLDVPERLPHIEIDQERILQLIGNLLSNAAKFTATEGRVTLSARHAGDDVIVSVRDTGAGIPRADLARLFDRFWHGRGAARPRGTGLGLSIAKGIVEAHRGRIWVDTIEGIGSTFSFSLPCPQSPTKPSRMSATAPAAGSAK